MNFTDDEIFLLVHHLGCFMSFFTPKKINNVFAVLIDSFYCLFCERFPAFFGMAVAFASSYRQNCIQHEYTLFCPRAQITMQTWFCWHFEVNFCVILKGFVDIYQWWRHLNSLINRKTHAHGLIWLNIWVLTHNYNLDILEIGLLICVENLVWWWKTLSLFVFSFNEFVKKLEFWVWDGWFERFIPGLTHCSWKSFKIIL